MAIYCRPCRGSRQRGEKKIGEIGAPAFFSFPPVKLGKGLARSMLLGTLYDYSNLAAYKKTVAGKHPTGHEGRRDEPEKTPKKGE